MKGQKTDKLRAVKKIILSKDSKKYFLRTLDEQFHSLKGKFSIEDLNNSEDTIISDKKESFGFFNPFFSDLFEKFSRGPQVVSPKDIGFVISKTGIGKDSLVIDAGGGSGSVTCSFAKICKSVTSYEIKEDFYNVIKKNVEFSGLDNVVIKNQNVFDGIEEKNIDLVFFDLESPEKGLEVVNSCLKIGGFFVVYCMSMFVVEKFCNTVRKSDLFCNPEVFEVNQRKWIVDEKRVRPDNDSSFHTGFLIFCRKIK